METPEIMEEGTQEANSAALLEPPGEVEENAVTKTPEEGSDNISLSELTTQLLDKEKTQGEEPEAGAEQAAPVEETELGTEREPEQTGQLDRTDESENDKQVLLDQYGINLDSLSEDQAMSLGRALRTESLKRFGRLTAQKREAESRVRELESNGASREVSTPAPATSAEDPMSEIWTEETLTKKGHDLQAIEDWVEDALQLETQYSDEGEEYLAEADGKRYTKEELLGIRANARKMTRKGGALEERRGFLISRQQFDDEAMNYFPWMSDDKSAEFGEYQKLVTQERYKKFLDNIPEANVVAGLLVEGNVRVRERMKTAPNDNGQPLREKPVSPATSLSAAPKRMSAVDGSRIKKAVSQAQKDFEATGSVHSLARLRELQNQMS